MVQRNRCIKLKQVLEDQPNQGGAEKQIEASLKALKDGDTNGALAHAEEAKNSLG